MEKDGNQYINEDKITKINDNSMQNERRKMKDKRIHSVDFSSMRNVNNIDSTNSKINTGLNRRR